MTGMAREGAMVGAMAGAKANEDDVSDSMIIDAPDFLLYFREGIKWRSVRTRAEIEVIR